MRAMLAGLALLGVVGVAQAQQAPAQRRAAPAPDPAALEREGLMPDGWPQPGRVGFAAAVLQRRSDDCVLTFLVFSNMPTPMPAFVVDVDVARGRWRERLHFQFPPVDPLTFRLEQAASRGPCPTANNQVLVRRLSFCAAAADCDGRAIPARPFRTVTAELIPVEMKLDR